MSTDKKKLLRDAIDEPIYGQYWNGEKFVVDNANGIDFRKVKMLRDATGSVIPQYWDGAKFVPNTSSGGGGGGEPGPPGDDGKSAYEIAVLNGFVGNEDEWLESLKGEPGPPGQDADVTAVTERVDNLETEVTEHLDQMKPKVDNSWQKGVYNDADIVNLGAKNATKTIIIADTDWKGTTNVEVAQIVLPLRRFSGLIKVSFASTWINFNAGGGAEVVYQIFKVTSTTHVNNMIINNISSQFAEAYRIQGAAITESGIVLSIVKSPQAKNTVVVKIELFSVFDSGGNDVFNSLRNTTVEMADIGLPPVGGYPWTPQTSNIPTKTQIDYWDRKSDSIAFDKSGSEGAYPDPNTFLDTTFITNHANAISEGQPNAFWYIEQVFYGGNGAPNARSQFARSYNNVNNPDMKVRHYHPQEGWSKWSPSIQQLFTSVSNGKAQVASAITGKGVQTASDATFSQMANNISQIPKGAKVFMAVVNLPAIAVGGTATVSVNTPFKPTDAMLNLDGAVLSNTIVQGTGWANRHSVYDIRLADAGNGNWTTFFDIRGGQLGGTAQTNRAMLISYL